MLLLHVAYDTILAVNVLAGVVLLDDVGTSYCFPSIEYILHAAVALSLLPTGKVAK